MIFNALSHKQKYQFLPLVVAIIGISGCDSARDEVACDSSAILIAVEQQLHMENDARDKSASLLSRFKNLGTSDGLLTVRDGSEKGKISASSELNCSVQAIFTPQAKPGQLLSADVLYTVAQQAKRVIVQITHTAEHIEIEQADATQ